MVNEIKTIDERIVLGKNFRIFGTFEEPLFLAKDVAEWIEHQDVTSMLRGIDSDEKTVLTLPTTLIASDPLNERNGISGTSNFTFLTEEGLYEVLMLSRKPLAKEFKKQVKEILKTVRKTGGFVADNREPEFIAKMFPSFSEDVKLMMVQDLLNKKQQMQMERDEAIRTKAQISDRKTATALGKVGGLTAANNRLRADIGFSKEYATIKRVEVMLRRSFGKSGYAPLRKYCGQNRLRITKVEDVNYGAVNAYPSEAWLAVYGVDLNQLVVEDNE